jgi:hypothetical protein
LESIFAAALCGVIYALSAAQPLAILGFTGPVLVFEKILYDLCRYVYELVFKTKIESQLNSFISDISTFKF